MEVLRPGVHFEERKSPRAYVTVFTVMLEGMNRHAFILLSSRVDVVKSSEEYISSVVPS
ncbi:MAG: hypothetical protein IKB72_01405 [Ruminococcus sp.]|nr:hypothetical protein [Ruminococcus sp.]